MRNRSTDARHVNGTVEPGIDRQQRTSPRISDVLFHFIKTGRLIKAVFSDSRVSSASKIFYVGTLLVVLAMLIFPEAMADIVSSFTVIGPIIGIPIEGVVDWTTMGVVAFSLMKVFPRDVVAYHYQQIFGIAPGA